MSKEVILTVLKRASEDIDFYSQLVQDHITALKDYDLTPSESTAIRTGDARWIELHIGAKIDKTLIEKVLIPLLSREQW